VQPSATADTLNPVAFRTVFCVKVSITNNTEIIIIDNNIAQTVVAVAFRKWRKSKNCIFSSFSVVSQVYLPDFCFSVDLS
jgi:hypothetical protein